VGAQALRLSAEPSRPKRGACFTESANGNLNHGLLLWKPHASRLAQRCLITLHYGAKRRGRYAPLAGVQETTTTTKK